MRHLLGVELTRLRWRRAVLLLLAACVLVPAVIFAATAWNTRPVSDADLARAERQVERDSERPAMQRQLERCVANPGRYGLAGDDIRAACEESMLPQLEWYLYRPQLELRGELGGSGVAVVTVLGVLLLLAGTTFAGHDWNSGSMSNQLLFETRRGRVWAAKALVVLAVGLVVSAAVLAAYWTGLWMLAGSWDRPTGGGVVGDGYAQVLRGSVFAACCGLGGYALTMLFRSTVATLGVLFAVSLVGPLLMVLISFPGYERWMPQTNVLAFVQHGATYWVGDAMTEKHLSFTGGAAYLVALLLVAALPSVASFRSRDVP
jgi:ABC-2 type transport system permease protein